MKIAIITDSLLSGGKERRIVELVKVLSKKPHYEFIIIMLEGKDAYSSIAYKEILDCPVKLIFLGNYNRLHLVQKIYKICKNENIELIHLWASLIYGYIIAPTHYLLNIPIISSSITSARKQGGKKFFLNKFTYRFYDKILSNSMQAFVINKVPEKKSICIYNGFDFKRGEVKESIEEIRSQYSINTKYIVSMAGEYSFRKDYPMFVRAANKVLKVNPDVTFLAMGSGDATPYKALIEPQFSDRIKFIGRVNNVESIYNASDIVVLATCVEGVSNAIMEGMYMGKPIVSTKGPNVGTKEIVEEGKSGFLVEYHDYNAFADYILKLLDNTELRKTMGAYGKRIVQEKFNIEQMIQGFNNVYEMYNK